jgi:HD-GYP domain-containing protein (c-di-GMP phosphodiesterase class II)
MPNVEHSPDRAADRETMLKKLIEIGIALSAERHLPSLLERILIEAMKFSSADGGTLYLRTADDRLNFAFMRTESLGVAFGGTTGQTSRAEPLALFVAGRENHGNVATHAALTGETVNIADAYRSEEFDCSGTRDFDARNGYRSTSFLTVPLKNSQDRVIGVLQLINVMGAHGRTVSFSRTIVPLIEALASQAAIALDNRQLLEAQRQLLESFIRVIAQAIDAKSPYTGAHCQRVPVITEMLSDAAIAAREGPFAGFSMSADERYELHIAAWLHDCGKVTTPEYVVDKATKLETLYDRIETIRTRFEVLKRDAEIAHLDGSLDQAGFQRLVTEFDEERRFLETMNVGREHVPDEDIARLQPIAARRWRDWTGAERPFLDDDELRNLSIRRGTLLPEEREVVRRHVVATIDMLKQLPFPDDLRRVPEYAGGHHEHMNGQVYPLGLRREQMSIPARMMAIADVFEALTAPDRPYKKAKTLSETMAIMRQMRDSGHLDPDLFDLFVAADIPVRYARAYMEPRLIDEAAMRQALSRHAASTRM